MRAFIILAASITFNIWVSNTGILLAQNFDIPRPSPKASVSQHIGVTAVVVEYGRPGVKDRKIFGDVIPFGKVWRTGANEATTISFPHNIHIEGKEIAAGKYGLFTIPNKDSWIIILNKNTDSTGTFFYDPEDDIVNLEIQTTKGEMLENFSIGFKKQEFGFSQMVLAWATTRVQIPISQKKG